MKVNLKKMVSRVCTVNSPYWNEIGTHETVSIVAYCGKCDYCVESARFYKDWNYCPNCGEKLDWVDEDEDKN